MLYLVINYSIEKVLRAGNRIEPLLRSYESPGCCDSRLSALLDAVSLSFLLAIALDVRLGLALLNVVAKQTLSCHGYLTTFW